MAAAVKGVGRVISGTSASKVFMLIGQCVPTVKQNATKIKVKRLEFDSNLNLYFKHDTFFYATDPGKKCKSGDIVLIQELPEQITKLITHRVLEIVHKFGDITDPITGKKVVVGRYREEIKRDNEMYGKSENAFDYDEAPQRGWQEGIKDYTDKPTRIHYHEFPEKDPYAV